MTPGQSAGVDQLTVTVLKGPDDPISGAEVVIDLSDCHDLVICNASSLVGSTNADGIAVLNPSVGGCDDCIVRVKADGVEICTYGTGVRSTDWDGIQADGLVNGLDLTFFAISFMSTQDSCADYDCSSAVDGIDLTTFAISFSCPDGCETR